MARLTARQQGALYWARKQRREASHSGPIDIGGVFSFLLEDGSSSIDLENGSFLLMENVTPGILLEDSSVLLLEDSRFILLEQYHA